MNKCYVPHDSCFPKLKENDLSDFDLSEKLDSSKISFIIPHKDNKRDFRRRVNLETCVHYYRSNFPQAEIIVVEQFEDQPTFQQKNVKTIAVQGQIFNKPKLMNLGWSKARNDILVFCDNDLLLEVDSILNCTTLVNNKHFDLISPYVLGVLLPESVKFFGSDLGKLKTSFRPNVIPHPVCGGSFVTTKEFYYDFGGFDESYYGWGPEDSSASVKAINTGKCSAYFPGLVFHLYHEPAANTQAEFYSIKSKNDEIFSKLLSLRKEEFEELVKRHREQLLSYKK